MFRSRGGGDEQENQIAICAFHHLRCVHGGYLRVEGRAPELRWYLGGVVSYADSAKTRVLGVAPSLLDAHGAVSEPVVCAMARGALERLGGDLSVAVSGIAGPDGASTRIRQDGYALLGLMARYEFAPGWSATLNLDNLTDEKYLTSLYWGQGYYGAPRNYTLSLNWRF